MQSKRSKFVDKETDLSTNSERRNQGKNHQIDVTKISMDLYMEGHNSLLVVGDEMKTQFFRGMVPSALRQ